MGIITPKNGANDNGDSLYWSIVIVIVLLLAVFAVIYYATNVDDMEFKTPELIITPLLILSVVALFITLVFTTTIFQHLGLTNKDQSLGLPEGSIRAVIALSLILIFMISSLFIYSQMGKTSIETSKGITQEMVLTFPSESIAWIVANKTVDNETLYNVGLKVEKSAASTDIAKQIITTVSTLVVAVAGFYFGTKAVQTAAGVTTISDPIIRSIEPKSGRRGVSIQFKIYGKNFELGDEGTVKLVFKNVEIKCTDVLSSSTVIDCKLLIPEDKEHEVGSVWSVVVTNADKGQALLDGAFTVMPSPVIEDVKQKGRDLTIVGKDFDLGKEGTVKLVQNNAEHDCEVSASTSTEINCQPRIKELKAGKYSVVVTNFDKVQATREAEINEIKGS